MTDKEICTVKDCKNSKSKGDMLFCFVDRNNWRNFCKLKEVEEIDIPSKDTELLLKEFQGGNYGFQQAIQ